MRPEWTSDGHRPREGMSRCRRSVRAPAAVAATQFPGSRRRRRRATHTGNVITVDRPPVPKDGCTQGIAKTIPGHVTPSTNDRRKASMKAREVMTDTVHAFTPDTPADVAAQYLHSHGYTAAPSPTNTAT